MRARSFVLVLALGGLAARAGAQPAPAASAAAAASGAPVSPPAGPSQDDRERANALMDEGDEKSEKGDAAGALAAYEKAHAIMRVPTTGIEVAKSLDKLGRLGAALAAARAVAALPLSPNEPAPFAQAREQAKTLASALEARVPTLAITVTVATAGAGFSVALDGRKLAAAELKAPMWLEPGRYRVTVEAPEHTPFSGEVTLKERDRAQVAVALAKLAPPPPVPTRPPPPPPPPGLSALVPAGFSIAGAGVIAGVVTGALALSAANEANTLCPAGACRNADDRTRAHGRYDSADALAVAADISFGLALAGAVIGLYGVATPPAGAAAAPAPPVTAKLLVGPSSAAVRFSF